MTKKKDKKEEPWYLVVGPFDAQTGKAIVVSGVFSQLPTSITRTSAASSRNPEDAGLPAIIAEWAASAVDGDVLDLADGRILMRVRQEGFRVLARLRQTSYEVRKHPKVTRPLYDRDE